LQSELLAYDAWGRQGLPDTVMAQAFLLAVVRLATTHDPNTETMLPTGKATVAELRLVLRALGLIPANTKKELIDVR